MILKKFENIKDFEGKPNWRDLFEELQTYSRGIVRGEKLYDEDILHYITWGEDFCMNVRPKPGDSRTENHMIMTTDTIGLVIFHNLGKVFLLKQAILNILKNWGFPKPVNVVTPGHNDLQLNGGKVFGSQIGVNGLMSWESGAIYLDWNDSKYETVTPEKAPNDYSIVNKLSKKQRAGSSGKITGLVPEGKRIGVSFNRDDFEELFLAEIKKLLLETEPVPFNMFEEVKE